ncbi:hypothetical protein [Sulfurimonas sp.]|uniref:hypothetical protein n=1 Tax=Sulfurimonas sp. TaxID=2022749 RepID=UPI003563D40D
MPDIRAKWEGPFSLEDIGIYKTNGGYRYEPKKDILNDEKEDCGTYSVYGKHPEFEYEFVVHFGETEGETFAKAFSKIDWKEYEFFKDLKIYVCRLTVYEYPKTMQEWKNLSIIYLNNNIRPKSSL